VLATSSSIGGQAVTDGTWSQKLLAG